MVFTKAEQYNLYRAFDKDPALWQEVLDFFDTNGLTWLRKLMSEAVSEGEPEQEKKWIPEIGELFYLVGVPETIYIPTYDIVVNEEYPYFDCIVVKSDVLAVGTPKVFNAYKRYFVPYTLK